MLEASFYGGPRPERIFAAGRRRSMPRYERGETWIELEVEDRRLLISAPEGDQSEAFDDEDLAEEAFDERVLALLKSGFKLIAEEEGLREQLERRVIQNPEAMDERRIFADLLIDEQDPRGELLAMQIQLETKPEDEMLRGQINAYMKAHREALVGNFSELLEEGLQVRWRLGYIESATFRSKIGGADQIGQWPTEALAEQLKTFLEHPSTRFLRTLSIEQVRSDWGDEACLDPIVEVIAETAGPFDALQHVELLPSRGKRHVRGAVRWRLNGASALLCRLPALKSLSIGADTLSVGPLKRSEVCALRVEYGVCPEVMQRLAATAWPQLESLDLALDNREYSPGHLDALLSARARFPKVSSLSLREADDTDHIVDVLLQTGWMAQLQNLNLVGGTMGDPSAHRLLQDVGCIRRLERLDLDGNALSPAAKTKLRALPCRVDFGMQVPLRERAGRYDGL